MIKRNTSLSDNIPSSEECHLLFHGFREKLEEEVVHARRAICLMIEGKAFLTTLLTTTIAFINGHMQCIDAVYQEFLES